MIQLVRGPTDPIHRVVACLQPATLNHILQSDSPEPLADAALTELLSRSIRAGLRLAS